MTMTDEIVCKYQFVEGLNKLFVKWGQGRYDHMKHDGLRYVLHEGGEEYVERVSDGAKCCVTGDSLTAIVCDLVESGLLQ